MDRGGKLALEVLILRSKDPLLVIWQGIPPHTLSRHLASGGRRQLTSIKSECHSVEQKRVPTIPGAFDMMKANLRGTYLH